MLKPRRLPEPPAGLRGQPDFEAYLSRLEQWNEENATKKQSPRLTWSTASPFDHGRRTSSLSSRPLESIMASREDFVHTTNTRTKISGAEAQFTVNIGPHVDDVHMGSTLRYMQFRSWLRAHLGYRKPPFSKRSLASLVVIAQLMVAVSMTKMCPRRYRRGSLPREPRRHVSPVPINVHLCTCHRHLALHHLHTLELSEVYLLQFTVSGPGRQCVHFRHQHVRLDPPPSVARRKLQIARWSHLALQWRQPGLGWHPARVNIARPDFVGIYLLQGSRPHCAVLLFEVCTIHQEVEIC